MNRREDLAQLVTMASMNKCLAQSNKSRTRGQSDYTAMLAPSAGTNEAGNIRAR